MKRIFYIGSASLIGAVAILLSLGFWHELERADANATNYMRQHHPVVSHAAKSMGDRVRKVAR